MVDEWSCWRWMSVEEEGMRKEEKVREEGGRSRGSSSRERAKASDQKPHASPTRVGNPLYWIQCTHPHGRRRVNEVLFRPIPCNYGLAYHVHDYWNIEATWCWANHTVERLKGETRRAAL